MKSAVSEILDAFEHKNYFKSNITYKKVIPGHPPIFADFPESLSAELASVLKKRGIEKLYYHQNKAIEALGRGENIVVVTPTASGKTLCYNLPVVQSILENPEARSLYLFPTKALSQDQYKELHEITGSLGHNIKVYTFDGDTPASARKAIRSSGQIVVTNPDMLHTGILPHHTKWIKLFENLRYIVIDEVHHYRGVFGSHFANLLRRLKRIFQFYQSKPQFICCSATIANPLELTENLVGEKFSLIDKSGAPRGEKVFYFYNPPVVNEELGIRRSSILEARRIAAYFLMNSVQTIVFARSRLRVEVLVKYLKREISRLKGDPERIRGYRGGYLPNERHEIEEGIKTGRILGVVSTNALELGIDIGQLNAAVLAGYPGTVSSTWQQGGRAGRKAETSVVVLVSTSSPLDQYIVNHPDYFFGSSPEAGIINPDNLAIMASHLKCSCFELPLDETNLGFGGTDIKPLLKHLEEGKILRYTGNRWFYTSDVYPAEEISLRSATAQNFVVLNVSKNNALLAEVDYDSAPFLIHESAIYIHQSQTFYIDRLDWERRTAYAREVEVDYYTDAQSKTDVRVLTEDAVSCINLPPPLESIVFGDVSVITIVAKYKKIKFETHENVGYGEVHTPPNEMQTECCWFTFKEDLKDILEAKGLVLGSGLRALANLLSNVVPLYVMCDPRDFRVVPMVRDPHSERPAIFIYDKYPGGIGIARRCFSIEKQLFFAAQEMIGGCHCADGCPSCIGPALELDGKGKSTALTLLNMIAHRENSI
ncbi:MAG TPA: DEAD/DEAH box helicase [Candidatus Sumerlaeota bacterium]|nr:MAG: putative DEAD-box ATP-dependent RNA helicase [candidate division BRC1 bacterium ADurb.Bin183]HOE64013.1 DEAD/DEAH box helicase [Candidatus Sumerlaeota bacterium]HRR30452.1 DEAD/DEAH box helicase [Candidatus Sumerlaeia bacterium]HON51082.1 DEAD/DEAH box helicase [Candidatus Sumerlaeota bacterium]HOR65039.1 DEAD/DEAH box helicase [Candidatus Sumerlaeota bacterium]